MPEAEFSAVIPAFNRAGTIAAAIRSVLDQSLAPREVIIVDDGSTDGTAEVAAAQDPRVQVIRQGNLGASAARNAGVRAATSRWIAFLDSDDRWLPGHLERMARAIDGTEGRAAFYFTDIVLDPEQGGRSLWQMIEFGIQGEFQLRSDGAEWALLPIQPMMLQSAVFERAAYQRADGLRVDLRTRHDTHLFFVMSLGQAVCAVAGCGAEMTADDRSGRRVTKAYGVDTPGYWVETLVMYEDVLSRDYRLRSTQTWDLRERIASAHLRLAAFAGRDRAWLEGTRHLLAAALRHPGRFASGLFRRLRAPLR